MTDEAVARRDRRAERAGPKPMHVRTSIPNRGGLHICFGAGARCACPGAEPCAADARQVSHGAIQFMVYEELKGLAGRVGAGSAHKRTVSSAEIIGIGALSKLAASIITYPSQARPQL
jgi:hypothetical protein